MAYQSNGYVDYVVDPLNRQTSFVYDTSGRVTQQILPGGRQINFSYDSNGNMTSLTPPEKPEHEFGYNSVDLTTEYNPPEVGGDGATGFSYNLAKQPTLVTLSSEGLGRAPREGGGRRFFSGMKNSGRGRK